MIDTKLKTLYIYIKEANLLIRPCNSETLDRLNMTYCMQMYGCKLWNFNK